MLPPFGSHVVKDRNRGSGHLMEDEHAARLAVMGTTAKLTSVRESVLPAAYRDVDFALGGIHPDVSSL